MKIKKRVLIVLALVFTVIIGAFAYNIYDKSLRRAVKKDGYYEFDGYTYDVISYTEIGDYNETYKVICKTENGSTSIYEIEEYPNHEYVVARMAWDAAVLKRRS